MMKNRISQTLLIAATTLFLSTAAAFPLLGSARSGSLDLAHAAQVANGPNLPAGHYRVELAQNTSKPEVLFYRQGKLVAQAPTAQLVERTKKSDMNKVYFNTASGKRVITQLDLKGWTQNIVFNSPNKGSTSAAGTGS